METRSSKRDSRRRAAIPKPVIYIGAGAFVVVVIALVAIFVMPGKSADVAEYEAYSDQQIQSALNNIKAPVSEQRRTVIESGISLLGKVHYFWGGKSLVDGWDDSWGKMELVESEGSQNTGKEMPYGLDCSGFVAWCVKQTGMTEAEVKNKLGLGTYWQWENSDEITWAELIPGDLVFQDVGGVSDNHVGICIGFTDEGEPAIMHCASSFDNVVVTGRGDVFQYPRRPKLYQD